MANAHAEADPLLRYCQQDIGINAWNFCSIIEFSFIGTHNYWAIIAATHRKRAAPTTIIESSFIEQKFQA